MAEEVRFIQILLGPRQVGKTTAAHQLIEDAKLPSRYVTTDSIIAPDVQWLQAQWELARQLTKEGKPALFVLDELQRIPDWAEVVKSLWDEDRKKNRPLHVLSSQDRPPCCLR